jgi:outer membrane protein OmpA-like peptidoglycan-associated protein
MTTTAWQTIAILACAAALVSGCSSRKQAAGPQLPGQAVVALLPDPDTNVTGKAYVQNTGGRVDLLAPRDVTTVTDRTAPQTVTTLTPNQVRELFGDALSALPPAQKHFTLFFRFDSEQLTDDSRALAPEIVKAVRERPVPDVLIVGHTDTTGPRTTNFALGLRRATTVRNLLRQDGLPTASIDIVSHGETELLVPTADGVFEARNRRVEITVR